MSYFIKNAALLVNCKKLSFENIKTDDTKKHYSGVLKVSIGSVFLVRFADYYVSFSKKH